MAYPAPLAAESTHKTCLWHVQEVEEMAEERPEKVERWTSKRRMALILTILRGETSAQEAARAHGLTVGEIEDWKDRFLAAGENAPRSRPKDEEAVKEDQIRKLKQKVGELVLDLDILKEASSNRPFEEGTSDE
jgi:transposase-like protein